MLEKLMKLLGVGVKEKAMVQFALDDAIETVKNYCHIKEMPEGLETTVIRMAMDIYQHENLGSSEVATVVTSVKAGDTTTSYQAVGDSTGYGQGLCKNYAAKLNQYRKLGW